MFSVTINRYYCYYPESGHLHRGVDTLMVGKQNSLVKRGVYFVLTCAPPLLLKQAYLENIGEIPQVEYVVELDSCRGEHLSQTQDFEE